MLPCIDSQICLLKNSNPVEGGLPDLPQSQPVSWRPLTKKAFCLAKFCEQAFISQLKHLIQENLPMLRTQCLPLLYRSSIENCFISLTSPFADPVSRPRDTDWKEVSAFLICSFRSVENRCSAKSCGRLGWVLRPL